MPKNNKRPLSSSIDDVFLSVLSLYHSIDLSSLNSISQGATNYQFFQLPNDDVLALKNKKNFFSRISFQRRRACESLMRIMLMVFIFLQTLFLEVPFLSLWNVDWSVFIEWKGKAKEIAWCWNNIWVLFLLEPLFHVSIHLKFSNFGNILRFSDELF